MSSTPPMSPISSPTSPTILASPSPATAAAAMTSASTSSSASTDTSTDKNATAPSMVPFPPLLHYENRSCKQRMVAETK
ncbi:hypothetical protein L211DRAFT_839770 [Terfezia boudieri ATCC MYA-4762]|uniref:Uncharacterized protein n=1 Tax=Terfezia boudieri ATCC MYA-4762 TaxID=1051890 RepID=A0A3N4LHQ0_9PEZI|nr:hypothetical protein L211DRAFT_839770 [Terfezia boudieri ATCC MYA-4762]